MQEAYAILTPDGFYTANRDVRPLGPPKLYATEANAQRQIDKAWPNSQLEHGAVVLITWEYHL